MSFEDQKTQEQKKSIYSTEKAGVAWAEGVQVWVVVEKHPNDKYVVRAEYDDPQKNIEDWFDVAPTSETNIESEEEAKEKADKLFADRENWPNE